MMCDKIVTHEVGQSMLRAAVMDVDESQNGIIEQGSVACVKDWQVKIIFLRRLNWGSSWC
jgi:hypothetical protein